MTIGKFLSTNWAQLTGQSAAIPERLLRESQAFCMAAWDSVHVAVDGDAKPCCEFRGSFGNVRTASLTDLWNGAKLGSIRKQFRRDQRLAACASCYKVEEFGGRSLRQHFNQRFFDQARKLGGAESARKPPLIPVHLDIRFSNLCNFSCRSCWIGASSKWHADSVALGLTRQTSALNRSFGSAAQAIAAVTPLLDTVQSIYWAGGEPLLMEEHYAVMEALAARGRTDVKLSYNTNLSELNAGKFNITQLWKKFSDITLGVSIDGADARGELIRHGLDWEQFTHNARQVKAACPHIKMNFAITVSVFNVFVLPELHAKLLALGVCGGNDFSLTVLQQDEVYSICILPADLKRQAAQNLNSYIASLPIEPGKDWQMHQKLQHVIDSMMGDDKSHLIERFRAQTLKLDALRGENTARLCPELAPLLMEPAIAS